MRPNLLFNPVALKELRQLVRSRTIIIGMILYPILLTIVSALTVSFRMQGRTKSDILLGPGLGEAPFYVAAVITGIVVCAALPLYAAFKTSSEAQKEKMGLEFVTMLTPANIISGKLLATALLMLIAIGLSMPVFTLAYLMRGVSLLQTFLMPAGLFLSGMIALCVLLFIACNKAWAPALRNIVCLIVYGIMLSFLVAQISLFGDSPMSPVHFRTLSAVGVLALIMICRATCAAQLSAPHLDALRPLRKTELVLYLLSPLAWLGGDDAFQAWIGTTAIGATIICLRAAFYPHPIPRVANLNAPRSWFGRFLTFPLTTGSVPGLVFGLRILLLAILALNFDDISNRQIREFFAACFEPVSLAIIISTILRLCHAGLRGYRITAGVSLGLFAFVNSAAILRTFDLCSRSAFDILPCCFHGITHTAETADYHFTLALSLFAIAEVLLLVSYIRAFHSYRRPQ